MSALSGQKTVTTAGTAVALGTDRIDGPLMIKALDTNTGIVAVGNDGAGDVTVLMVRALLPATAWSLSSSAAWLRSCSTAPSLARGFHGSYSIYDPCQTTRSKPYRLHPVLASACLQPLLFCSSRTLLQEQTAPCFPPIPQTWLPLVRLWVCSVLLAKLNTNHIAAVGGNYASGSIDATAYDVRITFTCVNTAASYSATADFGIVLRKGTGNWRGSVNTYSKVFRIWDTTVPLTLHAQFLFLLSQSPHPIHLSSLHKDLR